MESKQYLKNWLAPAEPDAASNTINLSTFCLEQSLHLLTSPTKVPVLSEKHLCNVQINQSTVLFISTYRKLCRSHLNVKDLKGLFEIKNIL